jgi:RNA polymerase sigma-70 factor, ECF subfamily
LPQRIVERDNKSLTDEELAQESQLGSLDAFEQLVYRYEHRIYAFVAQQFSNHMDAREVTQDTFVRAFQAIRQYDVRREFAPWLFTIARRKCIDRHRVAVPTATTEFPELPDLNNPHDVLAAADERVALWETARRCLPEVQYQALWLKYAQEMDVAQVAQVLRKTRIHTKVLLFRARKALALHLGKAGHLSGERSHLRLHPRSAHCIALAPGGGLLPLPGQKDPI